LRFFTDIGCGCFSSFLACFSFSIGVSCRYNVLGFFKFGIARSVHGQFEFTLLRPENNRLTIHTAYQIKRIFGLAPQGNLQKIFLYTRLYRFSYLVADLEVPVRRTQPANALVRPPVVVVLHPQPNPFLCVLKAFKLRTD
jgi:hypothetical protein